jgi:hypothetical protein
MKKEQRLNILKEKDGRKIERPSIISGTTIDLCTCNRGWIHEHEYYKFPLLKEKSYLISIGNHLYMKSILNM